MSWTYGRCCKVGIKWWSKKIVPSTSATCFGWAMGNTDSLMLEGEGSLERQSSFRKKKEEKEKGAGLVKSDHK